jgi:hypothetical protein
MALAALAGVGAWSLAALVTQKREPWDSGLYWFLFYPLMLAAAAALSYRHPQRPALIAVVLFEAQFVAMCIADRELGNLWPLGMLLFAVLALPGVAAARWAARRSPYNPQ